MTGLGQEKDIVMDYTPFETKELLVEFAMRTWPKMGMTTNLTDDDLERAISFDPEKLEDVDSGGLLYTGSDLHTVLENHKYELDRCEFLTKIGNQMSASPELQEQIKPMLEEELKQRGYYKHTKEGVTLKEQFIAIASARIKAAIVSHDMHDPYNYPRENYDFVVVLTTLRGGYAGTTQKQALYFRFPRKKDDTASYDTFLSTLQEATQLSVIPPLEPGEPYRTSSGPINADTARQNFDEDIETPVNALGIMHMTPPDSFPSTPAPTQLKWDTKGYTVNDGAWIYSSRLRREVLIGKLGPEKEKKLTDKDSYDNMILVLRSQREELTKNILTKPVPGTLVVEITHSMDAAAIKRWTQDQEAEAEEEKRFRAELRAQGFEDEDIGVPYGQYLKKEIAVEKERASRGYYSEDCKAAMQIELQKFTETAPSKAAIEDQRKKLLAKLDAKLKNIPRDRSGF